MTSRRLSSAIALAIGAIALAFTSSTARADSAYIPWDVPCCAIAGTTLGTGHTTITICNCSEETASYEWVLSSNQSGVTFDPPSGVVTLDPGDCITIPFSFICPTDLPPMNGALIDAQVVNLNDFSFFFAQGSIKPQIQWKVAVADTVVNAAVGQTVTASYLVSNIGSSGKDGVSISVSSMGQGQVDIQPRFPNPLILGPGESRVVEVDLTPQPSAALDHEPFVFYDIILSYDADGDGTPEDASSHLLQVGAAPCIGDLDGDGNVGASDLAQLLGRWGPCP